MSALPQRGARVEQVGLEQGVERVSKRAPDLVVLNVGNAQAVTRFADALRKRRAGTTTPVIVLCDDHAVAPLQAAKRSGIVARLDASASAEEVALALDTQLRAQTEALQEQRLPISAPEVASWVALAEKKGVCGLVLADGGPHVLVLGPEGATVPTAQGFLEALVTPLDPSLHFLEWPATRLRVLTEPPRKPPKAEVGNLPAVRVAVVHPDRRVRSLWERHMASAGAEVLFDEVEDEALSTLGESAPDLLVVHEHGLLALTRAGCWRDVRLQFSSLLVVSASHADEIYPHDLVVEAARLLAPHSRLQARIAEADLIMERVESLGPTRWLREVQAYDGLVELRVHAPQGSAQLRLDNGELHEARYLRDGEELHGNAALKALLDARFGCLIVGPPERVAEADVSHRLDAVVDAEAPQAWTRTEPFTLAESGPAVEPSSDSTPEAVDDASIGAAADEPAAEPSSSPELELELATTSGSDTTPELELPNKPASQHGALRPRAIALAALALLAIVGIAVGLQAPTPREQSARAPARALTRAAQPVAQTPSAEVVTIPPTADPPPSPPVAEAPAEEAPSVVQSAADLEEPSAALPAAEVAPPVEETTTAAQPENAAPTPAQLPAPIASAAATPSAVSAELAPTKPGAGAPELPSRLRRWLQPTPAQQRVIDAFWARVELNFVKAERLLLEARAMDPKEAEAPYQLALTYARQGRLDQTLNWARQAKEVSPLDPAPVVLEGDILALRGKPLEAEQAWKQCLQVRPGFPACVRRLEQRAARAGR